MKAIVLLSGGIDSATCLSIVVNKFDKPDVAAVSIFYGQRHEKELQSARAVAEYYGVNHYELDLSSIFEQSYCPLMAHSSRRIEHKSYSEQITSGGVSTYVPNLHGHNWIIIVTCRREKLNDCGMVVDFVKIKEIVNQLDHANINDVLGDVNPTAENIARWLCDKIPYCVRVEVQESEGNVAIYESQ